MSEIKIEKDVPMNLTRTRDCVYPFAKMNVGDSFSVPRKASIASAAVSHGYRHGKKFATRTEGENIRVWRTA